MPADLPIIVPTDLLADLRDRDMHELLQTIEPMHAPLVMVGDFNLTDQHQWYSRITERFLDAHRVAGWGRCGALTLCSTRPTSHRCEQVLGTSADRITDRWSQGWRSASGLSIGFCLLVPYHLQRGASHSAAPMGMSIAEVPTR